METRYLYRAKRLDNGEWVQGYLSYPFCTEKGNESYYFYAKDSLDFFCRCVVDASTICQCTGLTDKNGKLIWENDIVADNVIYGVVKWDDVNARYVIDDRDDGYQDYSEWWHEVKVIGNKFDNPELLEV